MHMINNKSSSDPSGKDYVQGRFEKFEGLYNNVEGLYKSLRIGNEHKHWLKEIRSELRGKSNGNLTNRDIDKAIADLDSHVHSALATIKKGRIWKKSENRYKKAKGEYDDLFKRADLDFGCSLSEPDDLY